MAVDLVSVLSLPLFNLSYNLFGVVDKKLSVLSLPLFNLSYNLFGVVDKKLSRDIAVALDFTGVKELEGNFLEEFLKRLYLKYPSSVLSSSMKAVHLGKTQAGFFKLAVEEARKFAYQKRENYVEGLYPYLNKKVLTPDGPGTLWQALTERAGVVLEKAPERVTFYDPLVVRGGA